MRLIPLIHLDRKYKYCWAWKLLVTWAKHPGYWEISIGYYPDYETRSKSIEMEVWL